MLLRDGRIEQRFRKALLPTYDVFDEDRYFEPFHGAQVLDIGGRRLGISICEDIWNDRDFWKRRRYHHDPIEELVARRRAGDRQPVGVAVHRRQARSGAKRCSSSMARKHGVPVVYVNQFGGNDDLVFDGRSCAFNAAGAPIARGRSFDARRRHLRSRRAARRSRPPTDVAAESEIWRALVLGTRDYVRKCGFARVRARAVGRHRLRAHRRDRRRGARRAPNVLGVLMPSPYSSRGSVDDALALAAQSRHRHADAADRAARCARWRARCADAFAGPPRDVTEENIQARIRGNLLMALSNKRGALLLTTGNKSELVGRLLHAVRRHVRRARR